MNRPLRLSHPERHEAGWTGDSRQLTSELVVHNLYVVVYYIAIVYKVHEQFVGSFSCCQTVVNWSTIYYSYLAVTDVASSYKR